MKRILSKKLSILMFLVLLFSCFSVLVFPPTPAHAQDVQLLPNASPDDYQVETSPYEGQEYEVRTAGPLQDIVTKTLGSLVNITFGLTGEQLFKWLGDVTHGGVLVAYTAVARTGGDLCVADPKTGEIVRDPETGELMDKCPTGYTATVYGGGNTGADFYCKCVKQTANGLQVLPPSGIAGQVGSMTTSILKQSPPTFTPPLSSKILWPTMFLALRPTPQQEPRCSRPSLASGLSCATSLMS